MIEFHYEDSDYLGKISPSTRWIGGILLQILTSMTSTISATLAVAKVCELSSKTLDSTEMDNQWVPSVQHISSTLKGHSFSAPKIPQFNTPLSFTPKTTRFNTNNLSIPPLPLSSTPKPLSSANPLSSTPKPFGPNSPQFNRPLRQKLCRTEEFLVWN